MISSQHIYEVRPRKDKRGAAGPKHFVRNFIFFEMSIFEFLRKYHEDKSNRPRLRPGLFLLVRRLKSVPRCCPRHPRLRNILSMMEEAMGITAIVFALIILLFGFDSIGKVKTRQQRYWLRRVLPPFTWMS
jgi:hypothetical protein